MPLVRVSNGGTPDWIPVGHLAFIGSTTSAAMPYTINSRFPTAIINVKGYSTLTAANTGSVGQWGNVSLLHHDGTITATSNFPGNPGSRSLTVSDVDYVVYSGNTNSTSSGPLTFSVS